MKELFVSDDQFVTFDGRPTVRVERHYTHPIDKVWLAVTSSDHLGQWFPSPVDIDLQPGGSVRFGAFGASEGQTGNVQALEPPRLLSFTWGEDRLTFELTSDGDGTTFALTHSFDDRSGAASFATGWGVCLTGLRALLAGEPPPPADRGIARHEELVHEFGLDLADVTETDTGWAVRIERQLTCPAAVAWDLWFGKDRNTGEQRHAPAVGEALTPYMAPDMVIGTMTEVDLHRVFAFDVAPTGGPGDHLRLEFADGTGHGVKIILTVEGSDSAERDAAVQMWAGGAVGHLAASAADWAMAQSVGP
jgi:uncharacterized protein YndB with AHSA1/START domain